MSIHRVVLCRTDLEVLGGLSDLRVCEALILRDSPSLHRIDWDTLPPMLSALDLTDCPGLPPPLRQRFSYTGLKDAREWDWFSRADPAGLPMSELLRWGELLLRSDLHSTPEDWLEVLEDVHLRAPHSELWQWMHALEDLDITGVRFDLTILSELTGLRRLITRLTSERILEILGALSRLQELEVGSLAPGTNLSVLAGLPPLRHLKLGGTLVDLASLVAATGPAPEALETLEVSDPGSLPSAEALSRLTSLVEVRLDQGDTPLDLAPLSACPALTSLKVL
ncbi:MAG: hypothetical protein ACI8S6_001246 [Myxococcota bacterium]|jgi:hypothetical protein